MKPLVQSQSHQFLQAYEIIYMGQMSDVSDVRSTSLPAVLCKSNVCLVCLSTSRAGPRSLAWKIDVAKVRLCRRHGWCGPKDRDLDSHNQSHVHPPTPSPASAHCYSLPSAWCSAWHHCSFCVGSHDLGL
jgi:hypothetical protein